MAEIERRTNDDDDTEDRVEQEWSWQVSSALHFIHTVRTGSKGFEHDDWQDVVALLVDRIVMLEEKLSRLTPPATVPETAGDNR